MTEPTGMDWKQANRDSRLRFEHVLQISEISIPLALEQPHQHRFGQFEETAWFAC